MLGQSLTWVRCMRLKNKPWAQPLIDTHPDKVIQLDAPFTLPLGYDDYRLEIGMGKGDFLLQMAEKNPKTFFIGLEKVMIVMGYALRKWLPLPQTNLVLVLAEFGGVYAYLPKQAFSHVYLNFSDPWPKIRHHKRRLTSLNHLEKITSLLQPGGCMIMKTDNEPLFDYTYQNVLKLPYDILSLQRPFHELESSDVATEYEKTFREKGQPIYRLVGRKHG